MKKFSPFKKGAVGYALALGFFLWGQAAAQVALDGTRLVYPASSNEIIASVRNVGDAPVLVQVWIGEDDKKQSPEDSRAPFALAPPLLRLDAGKDQKLRVRLVRDRAPGDDREHLYWLNLVVVPPRATAEPGESTLQLATRSRFKVLFRPAGIEPILPSKFADSMGYVVREGASGRELVINNPTAYHFNIGRIALVQNGTSHSLENPYVAPFSDRVIALPGGGGAGDLRFELSWLDDNGQLHAESKVLAQP
ncbi:molecular chaperone [Stenotrophomonas maltophilia]|uniref:Molecular chaperone n=1 Tax=Stenotrophomonas riyadhensis TaxID=2859893 RepID=A0ABT2XCR3_9GAMM|nr:molecular chaperone [Stenotrophomonas sp. CFS3442]MBH1619499.1 molecular chaperone [Stenotrophomonas maltophilia]MCV0323729.1 molecular chaperone [Stenotrophomonas sp. CFS3442]HEL4244672.1 molecular chaperone [Stenotrophomonas maltophilia]